MSLLDNSVFWDGSGHVVLPRHTPTNKIWVLVSKETRRIHPVEVSEGVKVVGWHTKKALLEDVEYSYETIQLNLDINDYNIKKMEVI